MPRTTSTIPVVWVLLQATFYIVPAAARDDETIRRGRDLVTANCARCHAVGSTDVGIHPDAPALRTLGRRYDPDQLQEALAEGISTGHPDMPEFVADPDQASAIIEYLKSIQE